MDIRDARARAGSRKSGQRASGAQPPEARKAASGKAAPVAAPISASGQRCPLGEIGGWVDRWVSFLDLVEGRKPQTAAAYRFAVDRFLADAKITRPAEITREAIEGHSKRQAISGLGTSTRTRSLQAIGQFSKYLVAHGELPANPAAGIRAPRAYRSEKSILTVLETKLLIYGGLDERLEPRGFLAFRSRVLWSVAYSAALRAAEIGRLRVADVAWHSDEGLYSILIAHGKHSRSDERIPLPRQASQMLAAYLAQLPKHAGKSPYLFPGVRRATPLTGRFIQELFAKALRDRKIEPRGRRLSPHTLRHSRATHLLDAGWDIRAVQTLLRHRSIQTTAAYLHTSEAKIMRYLKRQDPLEGKRRAQLPVGGALRAILGDLDGLAATRSTFPT